MLTVNNLVKHYNRHAALRGLSAEFREGCINVIIGPSGCGKTTLFHCVSGLEPFEQGTVSLKDKLILEASPLKPPKLTEIGYVLQGFSLFSHLNVLDNLTAAPRLVLQEPKKEAEARAHVLLEKMHLVEKQSAYPNQLSGGQQQRIAIARAIMMNPKVLLLDEPTNALDPQLVLTLERTLKDLAKEGLTLIVSTHHLGFAKRIADYSFFLHGGRILTSSEKADLLLHPEHPEIVAFIRKGESSAV